MIDTHHVLLDDRPVVEFLGDVVRGRPDEFHAALLGAPVRRGADERGQERVVDVDQRAADVRQEVVREDLHVARQHDQIGVAAQQIEQALFGIRAIVFRRGDMNERHAERPDLFGELRMVRDHHRHRHVQLTAAVAPQQIEQAVILLRGQDHDPFGLGRLGQPKIHLEPAGDILGEIAFQTIAGRRRAPADGKSSVA